ncbi:hypothetical protein XCR1_1580007 [Xenorhabdus cabanillasii JM26]|uniref:Uncharacterized protein n=1 Tax=Xenorhabdus cabanillasii JM26 TaxID=1427517 RepID=W1IUM2_9GAMM|nr:hypothetical protein Xcab_03269 [Xenorhabdus cabanillasii JM26]PHM77650.1 hypothetical protein Xcab_01871 [Xenorhabdus cabanillasii JM26]CDL81321.1 hypothetical protein XCR1_1580007 [Xenorhabdus cabanillasii JM26]
MVDINYKNSLRLSSQQFERQPSLRGLVSNRSYYWLVQILGFIPKVRSFSRQASLTHELKLPLSATPSICSSRTSSKRIVRRVLLFRSYGFLLFSSCIGSNRYGSLLNGGANHYKDEYHKKAMPRSGGTLSRHLTKPLVEVTIMAVQQHTQTRLKFTFLIASGTQRLVDIHPLRLISVQEVSHV